MKISIIIPAYNAEKTIERSIRSAISQTYKDIEIIIINDGSKDRTRKICEAFQKKDNRIRLYNYKNSGVSTARNHGLEKSDGTYLLFLDADDWIKPYAVQKMVDVAIREKVKICKFALEKTTRFLKVSSGYRGKLETVVESKSDIVKDIIFKTDYLCSSCGVLYERCDIEKLCFDGMISLGEDFLFFIEAACGCSRMYLSNEKLYCYKADVQSSTRKYNLMKNIKMTEDAIKVNRKIEQIVFDSEERKMHPRLYKSRRNVESLLDIIALNCSKEQFNEAILTIMNSEIINSELQLINYNYDIDIINDYYMKWRKIKTRSYFKRLIIRAI